MRGVSVLFWIALASGSLRAQQVCGAIVDTYRGVNAYSNGVDTGQTSAQSCEASARVISDPAGSQKFAGQDGEQFQCVEFIRRFYREAICPQRQCSVPPSPDLAGGRGWYDRLGEAQEFFPNPAYFGLVAYANGGPTPPQLDDIVAFALPMPNPALGHVAIIKEIDDSGGPQFTVRLIEQNTNQPHQLTISREQQSDGSYTYYAKPRCDSCMIIQGWLRLATSVRFSGTVTSVSGNQYIPAGEVNVGDSVSGTFTYDPGTIGSCSSAGCLYSLTGGGASLNLTIAGSGGTFTFGTLTPTPAPSNVDEIFVGIAPVTVGDSSGTVDSLEVLSPVTVPQGFTASSNNPATIDILLSNELTGPPYISAPFLTGTAIPTDWGSINLSLYQLPGHPPVIGVTGVWSISFQLASLQ